MALRDAVIDRRSVTIGLCLGFVLVSGGRALADNGEDLLALYRDLHAHPELSLHEVRTSARIADELERSGFAVTRAVGGHGVVAVLENGAGPTLLIRSDLDALPVKERTGLAYASTQTATDDGGREVSLMHACGHDVHMTVLVGTARELARQRAAWRGTLILIGQPAEERGLGAKAMLDDGLFDRFPRPDFNLALHVSAELAAGTVAVMGGAVAANVDSVDIAVHGVGGHGAYPHMTRDPVMLAASIVMNLQTLISRERPPLDPAVITVGSIHGGTKSNIISDRVDLELTVRSFSDATRRLLLDGIARLAQGQAHALGWPEEKLPVVTVREENTPAVWNDPALAERLRGAFAAVLGPEQVLRVSPTMGGEDFARYGRDDPRIPSVLFWLGAVDATRHAAAAENGTALPSLHSAEFAPDATTTIATGVKAMQAAALDLLAPGVP